MKYRTERKAAEAWDARQVKALREHMGVTQQELSDELGTRQQTVSEWERGLYAPRGASRTVLALVAERAGFEYRSDAREQAGKASTAPEGAAKEAGDGDGKG